MGRFQGSVGEKQKNNTEIKEQCKISPENNEKRIGANKDITGVVKPSFLPDSQSSTIDCTLNDIWNKKAVHQNGRNDLESYSIERNIIPLDCVSNVKSTRYCSYPMIKEVMRETGGSRHPLSISRPPLKTSIRIILPSVTPCDNEAKSSRQRDGEKNPTSKRKKINFANLKRGSRKQRPARELTLPLIHFSPLFSFQGENFFESKFCDSKQGQ